MINGERLLTHLNQLREFGRCGNGVVRPCLTPVDFVEGFIHLAEDVFVPLGECDVVASGAFRRLRSGFVAHDA